MFSFRLKGTAMSTATNRARLVALRVFRDAMNELTPGTGVPSQGKNQPPTKKGMLTFYTALSAALPADHASRAALDAAKLTYGTAFAAAADLEDAEGSDDGSGDDSDGSDSSDGDSDTSMAAMPQQAMQDGSPQKQAKKGFRVHASAFMATYNDAAITAETWEPFKKWLLDKVDGWGVAFKHYTATMEKSRQKQKHKDASS